MPDAELGLHAMLVGVSAYDSPPPPGDAPTRPFIAGPLDGPSRTVAALEAWLKAPSTQLLLPLKSLRLLASPSESERAQDARLTNCEPATRDNVLTALRAWRKEASQKQGDMTLFYFAGHGIQRSSTDSVMLLQDFNLGFTLLDRAISLANVFGGMGSTRGLPSLARTQWYFADCCRSVVDTLRDFELASTSEVFSVEANLADDRKAVTFLAANSGQEAFAPPGKCTAFGSDVLTCLSGTGADRARVENKACWVVSANSLLEGMSYLTDEYNASMAQQIADWNLANPNQRVSRTIRRTPVSNLAGNPLLCTLAQAPTVSCSFQPRLETLLSVVDLQIGPSTVPQLTKHVPPFEALNGLQLPAGSYNIGATLLDPLSPGTERKVPPQPVWVNPPYCVLDVPT